MTLLVKLSALTIPLEQFVARVEAHIARLIEYYRHLEGVREDAANPDLSPQDRRVAFPPPSEDDLIEKAIVHETQADGRVTVRADYEVTGPTLTEKKAALAAHAREIEAAAHHANIPAAKRRHFQLRAADIHAADQKRVEENPERVDNAFAFMTETRDPDDTAFLADQQARSTTEAAIVRWAAKMEHDIEDLTEETVDAFVVAPFNG